MTDDEKGDKLYELAHDAGFDSVDVLVYREDKNVYFGCGEKKEGTEYSSNRYFIEENDDVRVATDDEEKMFAKFHQLVIDSGFDSVKFLFKDGDKTIYDHCGKAREDAKYKNVWYFIEEHGKVRHSSGDETWDYLERSMQQAVEQEKKNKAAGIPDDPAVLADFKKRLIDALTNSFQVEGDEKPKRKPRKRRKSGGSC